jgi:xanthine dehydrogenase iron-sulfur cluster and FAD-binding subunit A
MPLTKDGKIFEIRTRLCKKVDGSYDHGPFGVDERLQTVECRTCGERMNASWVLSQIAHWESMIEQKKRQAEEAIVKNLCKCEHCGKITHVIR